MLQADVYGAKAPIRAYYPQLAGALMQTYQVSHIHKVRGLGTTALNSTLSTPITITIYKCRYIKLTTTKKCIHVLMCVYCVYMSVYVCAQINVFLL